MSHQTHYRYIGDGVDIGQYNSGATQYRYLYKITLNVRCINAEMKQDCFSIKGRPHVYGVQTRFSALCSCEFDIAPMLLLLSYTFRSRSWSARRWHHRLQSVV